MHVEDIATQSRLFSNMTEKDPIFGVHVFQGSADIRRGEITNHHSTAYSLSNISAKKY